MSDQVHVGRDGWLFLTGGNNRVIKLYRRSPAVWWKLWRWQKLIEARAARCRDLGCRFVQAVVPEKLSVMAQWCATPLADPALSPALRLRQRMGTSPARSNLVDLVTPLRDAAARDDGLYHRTDTHWTYRGCYLGYAEICRHLGASPLPDLLDRPFVLADEFLDLGSKLTPPMSETIRIHTTTRLAERTYVNELITAHREGRTTLFPITGSHAIYENRSPSADPRRVVLFGDSCSSFNAVALTGLLSETFRRVEFIWSASIDWRLVERLKPDILICALAERFLNKIPADDFDLDTFVAKRLQGAARAAATTAMV